MKNNFNYTESLWYEPSKYEIQHALPVDYLVETWYFQSPYSDWLTREFQIMLLERLLIHRKMHPITIQELENMQENLFEQNWFFNNKLQTISIKEITKYIWSPEDIIAYLEYIGAKSTLFERYAWRRKFQRDTSQLNSFLQTETCRV